MSKKKPILKKTRSPFKVSSLPEVIKVKISRGEKGAFIAELPEYSVFTEADTPEELDFYINDLIYTVFDVPKRWQWKKIRYLPLKNPARREPELSVSKQALLFTIFSTPDFYKHHFA